MSGIKDQLGDHPPAWAYPDQPGFKEPTTSKLAAKRVEPSVRELRQKVYAAIAERPGSCEEIAERTGIRLGTVRPRVSELRTARKVRPLFENGAAVRRKNDGGSTTIVWETGEEMGALE